MAGMTLTRRRIAIAAVAFATFGLLGVIPATAALDDAEELYGTYTDFGSGGSVLAQGLGVVSDTDATIAPLPELLPNTIDFAGIEIVDGVGYAVGRDNVGTASVFRWDVATGKLINTFEVTTTLGEIDEIGTLTATQNDAELPDGTLVTLAIIDIPEDGSEAWVGSLDPVTGVFTPLVNLSVLFDAPGQFYVDSLASDPISGLTYAFSDTDSGDPSVIVLDLNNDSYLGPDLLTGILDSIDPRYVAGADFDSDGILWFYVFDSQNALARTTGAFAADVTATIVGLSSEPGPGGGRGQNIDTLAIGPAPAPVLAATGAGAPIEQLLLGGVALLALGGVVLAVTRRRAAVSPTA